MRAQLVEMFGRQRKLFAQLGTMPPSGPMAPAESNVVRDAPNMKTQYATFLACLRVLSSLPRINRS